MPGPSSRAFLTIISAESLNYTEELAVRPLYIQRPIMGLSVVESCENINGEHLKYPIRYLDAAEPGLWVTRSAQFTAVTHDGSGWTRGILGAFIHMSMLAHFFGNSWQPISISILRTMVLFKLLADARRLGLPPKVLLAGWKLYPAYCFEARSVGLADR